MADVLSELMARRGYARIRAAAAYEQAWHDVAGNLLAQYTRVGTLRRGALEIIVANSTLLQELTFQKADLLKRLAERLPDEGIRDLRLRLGAIA
jgi:predicted nucleic acid-binding Zn ribbon protein